MAFNSKWRQLTDDDIDLLLGSSEKKNSDLDPSCLENDGDTSYDNDEEGGSNLSAILGGAAASNNDWVTQRQLRSKFPFSRNPSIKVNIADADDTLAYFKLVFNDTLINIIVQQINLYAKQYKDLQRSTLRKRSHYQKWIDTNEKEIRVYLGLLMLQGYVQKPVTNLFFSKKKSIQIPFFPATIEQVFVHMTCSFCYHLLFITTKKTIKSEKFSKKIRSTYFDIDSNLPSETILL